MDIKNWTEDDWSTLILTIQLGNCILMLGSDLVFEQDGKKKKPLTEILANELAQTDYIKNDVKNWKVDPGNLAQVSQCYYKKTGRIDLEQKVLSFYNNRKNMCVDFHEDLAALPFTSIITTTPDTVFLQALKKAGKEPVIEIFNFKGENRETFAEGTTEEPLLYYLFGKTDEPGSMVLTENDFLDFLMNVASHNPKLPNTIVSKLRDNKQTLLFLGFGFENWYLRILLHVLNIGKKESRSFALEQFSPESPDEFQRMVYFYRESDYKIQISHMDLDEFTKELRKRYQKQEKATPTGPKKTAIPKSPDAPTVFLCHASENKEYASWVYEQLEAAGIKPWLDKEDIRGGDMWDRLILKTIKEIDYFVVLQSKVLNEKIEGYANKEIFFALDRQKEFKIGIRFIIPVKIEECPLMESLEMFHTIDISGKENIEELITTIRRDYERRRKK